MTFWRPRARVLPVCQAGSHESTLSGRRCPEPGVPEPPGLLLLPQVRQSSRQRAGRPSLGPAPAQCTRSCCTVQIRLCSVRCHHAPSSTRRRMRTEHRSNGFAHGTRAQVSRDCASNALGRVLYRHRLLRARASRHLDASGGARPVPPSDPEQERPPHITSHPPAPHHGAELGHGHPATTHALTML